MEPIYMVEVFIDQVTATGLAKEIGEKKFVVTLKFGPIFEFSITESELVDPSDDQPRLHATPPTEDDVCRYIRCGKSYTFPAYPDTLMSMLNKFPFEVTVMTDGPTPESDEDKQDDNDDDDEEENKGPKEEKIFVGCGKMQWSQEVYNMIRESADIRKAAKTVTVKQEIKLSDESYCKKLGAISLILRISALGNNITSSFQQVKRFPDLFLFRSDKSLSVFQCKRKDEDGDPNFVMLATLYESATLEDPEITHAIQTKYLVCNELEDCGLNRDDVMFVCGKKVGKDEDKPRLQTIKLKDIKGPCGNPNCGVAQRIRDLVRATHKPQSPCSSATSDKRAEDWPQCGKCICPEPIIKHRRGCPKFIENQPEENKDAKPINCNNIMRNEDNNPRGNCNTFRLEFSESFTGVNKERPEGCNCNCYISDSSESHNGEPSAGGCTCGGCGFNFKRDQEVYHCTTCCCQSCFYGRQCSFCPNNCQYCYNCQYFGDFPFYYDIQCYENQEESCPCSCTCGSHCTSTCRCGTDCNIFNKPSVKDAGQTMKQNESQQARSIDPKMESKMNSCPDANLGKEPMCEAPYYECLIDSEECNCADIPPTPLPTCGGKNCQCREKALDRAQRAKHRKYCEAYPHKPDCPVLESDEDEEDGEEKPIEEESDDEEKHPLGLPPIKLGPCPVLGRPCCVKDGFANMYKVQAQKALPKSYDEAGKICCSEEFNRIKAYLQDYMRPAKPYGSIRECSPAFSLDLAGRCCDKGATVGNLKNLAGGSCCARHKLQKK